ncbi:hypothetical protein J6590_014956 [Homalodisca vitripennis]|nr:hypothetical protein J6590_014956 [Homalodisca vitripennis]
MIFGVDNWNLQRLLLLCILDLRHTTAVVGRRTRPLPHMWWSQLCWSWVWFNPDLLRSSRGHNRFYHDVISLKINKQHTLPASRVDGDGGEDLEMSGNRYASSA